jgi:FkbH-like protein
VRLTAEDEARQTLYATGREASQWKATAGSHDNFLRGLEQRLTIGRVQAATVARVAQMHQRTNQFNLTTVRSTEADIAAMASEDGPGIVLYGRATDRFGDHGIVIAAVAEIVGNEAFLRSLLMSCRVIGREVERAFLGELLRELARRGVGRVYGEYIPTAKNAMVRDFYSSCGFAQAQADEGSGTTWVLNLSDTELPGSQFVTVVWEV